MHLLVTGGTGFIGRHLIDALLKRGYRVSLLARDFDKAKKIFNGTVNLLGTLEGAPLDIDGVINLAGEPIADKRWTKKRKQQLVESRVATTDKLVEWMAQAEVKPKVLLSASAVGYYGNYPENLTLDEQTKPRFGFASDLCRQWEASAAKAESLGVRVCQLRIGVVFGVNGGALKKMLPTFKLGLGGRIGDGWQWFSWIHMADMVNVILFLLDHDRISGPVNAVAPNPVTNRELTRQLARLLKRPAVLPVPELALQVLMGESSSLLTQGQEVVPKKLLQYGFRYQYPRLEEALQAVL